MATLKDVAKEAGVSIATVSCALTGSKPVSPKAYSRVMDAVEKLRYIPNASARGLRSAQRSFIGVILPDMKSRAYAEIFDGISSYVQNNSYSINIAFSNGSPDLECSRIDDFIGLNCAGLMIVTTQPQNTAFFQEHIIDYGIPVVFIDREPDNISANYVGIQNYDTFYSLTAGLLQKGYRRISIMCGPTEFSPERDSLQGCIDAISAFDPERDPEQICVTNMTREDAFRCFLKDLSENPPEVLLSTSREITYGIQAALEYCSLKIPDDMLLVSSSERSWVNINSSSGMILLPNETVSLGEQAAKILLGNIQNPGTFEREIVRLRCSEPDPASLVPRRKKQASKTTHKGHKMKDLIRLLAIDNPTVWALELLIKNFTNATGISVEITRIAQDTLFGMVSKEREKLTENYDLYTFDVPWLEYMVQNFILADLTEFTESENFPQDQIFRQSLLNCRIENRYFGVPFSGGTQLLFYREDLFESRSLRKEYQKLCQRTLNVPRTWKEFNDVAAFFTRSQNPASPTEFGTSLAGIIDEELAPEILIRLWTFGGQLWDRYHRPTFATKENHLAFESLFQTLKSTPEQDLSSSINRTVEDFCSGRTAMLITYSEFAQKISRPLQTGMTGRIGACCIPGKHPASVGWNIGLNPYSPHRESAFAFLSWLFRMDTGFYLTVLNGASPITAPYHNHELRKLYPWLRYTEESIAYSTRRNSPYRKRNLILPPNEIEHILCRAVRRIISEKISIDEALYLAQQEGNHLFKMYGYPIMRTGL